MTSQILAPDLVWELLRQHGSPLLVGSRSIVRQQIRCLRANLPSIDWFFAVKANSDPELLHTLASEGCGFDVASYSELAQAKNCLRRGGSVSELCQETQSLATPRVSNLSPEYDMSRVVHSHPCKSAADTIECYRAGQRRFVIDCESELNKIATVAPDAKLLIRLNVRLGSARVAFADRFGAPIDAIARLAMRSQAMGLSIEGLAFHVGSQAIDPSDFDAALSAARAAWKLVEAAGVKLSILDIGGGFPVSYRDQSVLPLESYCQTVNRMIEEKFGDIKAKFIAEPGRVLCAEAVSLITTVIGKQRRLGKPWYTVDDGLYGSFSGRYFSTDSFDFFPYPKSRDTHSRYPSKADGSLEPSMIAGPTCDGGDIVARDYPLPNLEVGDAIVTTNMGAYTAVSASQFNGIPRAKSVWVD